MSERVKIIVQKNGSDIELESDPIASAFPSIEYEHHEIHEGHHYVFGHTADGVANAATVDILIKTTGCSRVPHLTGEVQSNLQGNISFYEGLTVSADGTTLSINNNNRNSSNVASCTAFHTPTVGATLGTELFAQSMFGAGRNIGGNVKREREFVLAPDQKYLLRFTSDAASNTVNMILDFYDH